jgi:uncharacterized Tic20 family protein
MAEEEKTPAPEAPKASSGSSDDNNMAILAHVLGIFTGFVGPLVIYLVTKDKPYAYKQAKEALNFQITITIAWVVSWILALVFIGFLLMAVVWVYSLIMAIMAAMACSKGEDYRYPLAMRLVK